MVAESLRKCTLLACEGLLTSALRHSKKKVPPCEVPTFLGTTSVSSPRSLYLTSLPSLLLGTVQSRSPPPHSIGLVSVGCSLYGIFPGLVVVDDRFHAQHFSTATIIHLCYVLGACRSIFKSTSTNVDYPQSHSVLGSRAATETGAFSVAWSGILFFLHAHKPLPNSVIKLSNKQSWKCCTSYNEYGGIRLQSYSNTFDLRDYAAKPRTGSRYQFILY